MMKPTAAKMAAPMALMAAMRPKSRGIDGDLIMLLFTYATPCNLAKEKNVEVLEKIRGREIKDL